jgi:hypothetical protein
LIFAANWKPGFYVFLDGKPLRGPYRSQKQADEIFDLLRDQYRSMMPDGERIANLLSVGKIVAHT